ncbi:hypothetical protein V9T40_014717 [Parthenolecanium corni]|uniref:Uncharacterized protein n=1 Tax=Parthenolecanium corni TaxID=536013 RepID=A0AAN9XY37_9HEMI
MSLDVNVTPGVVSEVPCVRIPLQTTYVSPTSPETTIFMYTSNADNQGSVELHLPDAANSVDEKTFTSVFAKLEQDQDSYTISYQDDSNPVLSQNNIDILLGAAALQSNATPTHFVEEMIVERALKEMGFCGGGSRLIPDRLLVETVVPTPPSTRIARHKILAKV